MVEIDWDRIRGVKAVSLTDDEIEDLFPMVIGCDTEQVDNIHNLRALIKLSQEMLQYKDNQVESLALECDELKTKITSNLTPKRNKKIIDNGVSQINDFSSSNYEEILRTKNDKIKTLMNELKEFEKENEELKEKLENLKEEMEDATENMNEMTEELNNLNGKLLALKEEAANLKREKQALVNQIEEMTAQQIDRDKVIDEFGAAIDERVSEWKRILDSKDAEISRLKDQLSQSLINPSTSRNVTAEIVYLNEEIDKRDKIIEDLKVKLSEAAAEINESAGLIEKLNGDLKKMEKSGKRKEQRDLLKKIQDANEKIAILNSSLVESENNLMAKSQQLCEVLDSLKKYQNKDQGLTECINEIKELKKQLAAKTNHIQDLVNVVNKLEALNSKQEVQIIALREKLGMSDDEEICVEAVELRYQEEARVKNELLKRAELLEQENLDLKSDIRALKYKLSKFSDKPILSSRDSPDKKPNQDNSSTINWTDEGFISLRRKSELDEVQENMRVIVEENEALRKGMHEILDSIHDQDGKSSIEIQSDILERLLEALDVRHLAGWYHPAMRLQERLNVIQGSNNELRSQLKQLRKEIQKKDNILKKVALKQDYQNSLTNSESESEEAKIYALEIEKIQTRYENDYDEWQKERESFTQQITELKELKEKLETQLGIYEKDLKVLESSDDEIKQAFAIRSKEYTDLMTSEKVTKRKVKLLESLLNEELQKIYFVKKETIASESAYKKTIADLEKGIKLLEQKVAKLEDSLTRTVSRDDFDELNKKYNQLHLRYRVLYEVQLSVNENSDFKGLEKINAELQEQLAGLQTLLMDKMNWEFQGKNGSESLSEMEEEILKLRNENDNLIKSLEISRDEAQKHYLTNSLKIFEVDTLRHQIVDLQAVSEDKETIARLGFELNTCKAVEMETNIYKTQLESEVARIKKNLEVSEEKCAEIQSRLEEYRNYSDKKFKNYELVIEFLRNQYSGSTSATSLQRYEEFMADLRRNRAEVEAQVKETKEAVERARIQQETLTSRLEIVERLKDILEQQIGSANVEDIIKNFSENSQNTLNEFRYKRKISQLETELQVQINKLTEYEGIIVEMEYEMVKNQKAWKNFDNLVVKSPGKNQAVRSPVKEREEKQLESLVEKSQVERNEKVLEKKSISTQIDVFTKVIGVQTDIDLKELPKKEVLVKNTENLEEKASEFLENQLKEALTLASDRSAKLIKYESQITEYQAKIEALNRSIEEKDGELIEQKRIIAQKSSESVENEEAKDKVTLKSTTNSLQKIITQKEETILRYQNLLKEERDEYNKATARLQEQINKLNGQIDTLKSEQDNANRSDSVRNESKDSKIKLDIDSEDKIVRLTEQVSNLQADLETANELNERWRRLAEERLEHVDEIRSKLELQHKNELESYRREIDKWQLETSALRQQLSDNRIKLTKGNITLTKELQERDNKIEELTVAYQQLQTEFEMMELGQTPSQHSNKLNDLNHSYDQLNHSRHNSNENNFQSQSHVTPEFDLLRKQYKSLVEKEKMYKEQIVDLKQQLSRRYMAEKSEERKTSMREAQLEKKLKSLEEELNKARVQLDREYRLQESKRIKTAEELSLWEKQKKWQGLSEKLKRELKEKEAEIKKLNVNYEKLRSIVSCMEREKWFLRSKIKAEDSGSSRPDFNLKVIEDLQRECQTLRDRIKELTDRLETEDTQRLVVLVDQQKRRIAALEVAAGGNSSVVDQLEALEAAKSTLEKKNIKLESENFELRMELEKVNNDTPRLKEKVQHLEKYVQLLKIEKSSDSSASSEKDHEDGSKKSPVELERTIFVLKRIVEKLQVENKRLRVAAKSNNRPAASVYRRDTNCKCKNEDYAVLKRQYEEAKKRVVALETDLQLAEQRIKMLEDIHKEDTSAEIDVLKQQLAHKSELLDKVKQLLTRAAINEKALRQRIQQIEMKQTLSTIPECQLPSPTPN